MSTYALLETLEREYRFHPTRLWRFDFAFAYRKIAIEIEGGTWSGGRHTRGSGYAEDCLKYNEAAKLGWTILRYTSKKSLMRLPEDLKYIWARHKPWREIFKDMMQKEHALWEKDRDLGEYSKGGARSALGVLNWITGINNNLDGEKK